MKNHVQHRITDNFLRYKNNKINTSFVSPCLCPLGADKTGFNLKILHFDIRGKLSIIRCDRYIYSITGVSGLARDDNGIKQKKEVTGKDMLRAMGSYIWPENNLPVKARVVTALTLLVGAKERHFC